MFEEPKGTILITRRIAAVVLTIAILLLPYHQEAAYARKYRGDGPDLGGWAKDFGGALFYAPMTGGASLGARAFSQAVISTGRYYGWSESFIGITSGIPTALTQPFGNPFQDPEKFLVNVAITAAIVIVTLGVGAVISAGTTAGSAAATTTTTAATTTAATTTAATTTAATTTAATTTAATATTAATTTTSTLGQIGNFFTNAATNFATNVANFGRGAYSLATVQPGAWSTFGSAFATKISSATTIGSAVSRAAAVQSINNVVGVIAYYTGMDPRWSYALSSVASAGVLGFVDPGMSLASGSTSMMTATLTDRAQGALVGAMGGAAEAGTVLAIDSMQGNKIKHGKSPSIEAVLGGKLTGTYFTFVGREMFNPSGTTQGHYAKVQIKQPESPMAIPQETPRFGYQKLDWDSKTGIFSPTGEPIPAQEFENNFGDALGSKTKIAEVGSYKSQAIQAPMDSKIPAVGQVRVINLNDNPSVWLAAAKNTVNMWPSFVSTALQLYTAKAIAKDREYLQPLVRGVTGALAQPFLFSAQTAFGLRWMDEKEGLDFEIARTNMIKTEAWKTRMGAIRQELSSEQFQQLDLSRQNDQQKAFELLREKGLMSEDTTLDKFKQDLSGLYSSIQKNDRLTSDQRADLVKPDSLLNAVTRGALKSQYAEMDIGRVMNDAKISRSDVYLGRAWGTARFGIFEALVSGGLQAVIGKNFKSGTAEYLLATGGSYLFSNLIRGTVWSNDSTLDGWSGGARKHAQETVRVFSGPQFDALTKVSGLEPQGLGQTYPSEDGTPVELKYLDFIPKAPNPTDALLKSSEFTTREFIWEALSFGSPQIKSSQDNTQINPLTWLNYVGQLKYYSSLPYSKGGFNALFSECVGNGFTTAAATNISTTLASTPVISTALKSVFNVAPLRGVGTNWPGMPFAVQVWQRDNYRGGDWVFTQAPANQVLLTPFTIEAAQLRNAINLRYYLQSKEIGILDK